jgi:hypothetical protein
MAVAPASVVFLAAVFGQSPEAVTPVAPRPVPKLLAPLPAPRAPVPTDDELVLRPAGDGSGDLVYEGKGIRARVAPDGSVRFDDKRLTGLSLTPWLPMGAQLAVPSLQSSLKLLLRGKPAPPPPERDERGPPPETTQVIPLVSRYLADPREGCRTCAFDAKPMVFNAIGRFDLTDELLRLDGQDPYRLEKARFLAVTHDVRIKMAAKAHADNIRRAAAALPERLHAIACDAQLSATEKRAVLAALRDEMNTSPEGRDAAARVGDFLARLDRPNGSVVDCGREPQREPQQGSRPLGR